MESVEVRIKKSVANVIGVSYDEVKDDSTLMTLGGDSLDHMEIILDVESEFNLGAEDVKWSYTGTIGELVELATAAINKRDKKAAKGKD